MSFQLVILIIGILWFFITYLLLFYFFSGSIVKEEVKVIDHGNLREENAIVNDTNKWPYNIVTHNYNQYVYANFSYQNIHRVNKVKKSYCMI